MAKANIDFWGKRRLATRLRWHFRRVPHVVFLLVAGILAAVGVACQVSSISFVAGVGQNLFADALLLVVAALVLDRLSKERERNDTARPFQVVYSELRDIYSRVTTLWIRWLVVACGARVEEMKDLPNDAFVKANETKIENIDLSRLPSEATRKVLQFLAADALACQTAIDGSYARIAPFGDLNALAMLHSLRTSGFLAWSIQSPRSFAESGRFGVSGIGRNLLFRATEHQQLVLSMGAKPADVEGLWGATPDRLEWENAADIMRSLAAHLQELGHLVSPYMHSFALNDRVDLVRLGIAWRDLGLVPVGNVEAWIAEVEAAARATSKSA
jgi:hypothetical protein